MYQYDESMLGSALRQRQCGYSVVESFERVGLMAPDEEVSADAWEVDEYRDLPYSAKE